MSDGWGNPVVGGADNLIRRAIQSPNYSPGAAGWTINADGTAEFNGVTFRGAVVLASSGEDLLAYTGTPAAGNLFFALSPNGGTDAFGNTYFRGANFYGAGAVLATQWGYTAGSLDGIIYVNGAGPASRDFFVNAATRDLVITAARDVRIVNGGFGNLRMGSVGGYVQWGSGFLGGQCSRCASFSQAGVPNGGVPTVINGATTIDDADDTGGGNWAAGTFTVPLDGFYDASMFCDGTVNATRAVIRYDGVPIATNQGENGTDASTAVISHKMVAGKLLRFATYQNSGAARTVTGFINVARRL